MLIGIASGRLTKDAVTRQVGKDSCTSFSVATNHYVKKEKKAIFVDCALWGKRGESLAQHLTKGTPVTCTGELTTNEKDGKFYVKLKVDQINLLGSGSSSGGSTQKNTKPVDEPEDDDSGGGGDDDIPF